MENYYLQDATACSMLSTNGCNSMRLTPKETHPSNVIQGTGPPPNADQWISIKVLMLDNISGSPMYRY